MLGQRLAHLEAENKHKEEIAQIREEQIRMMSQLMLLNASQKTGGESVEKQQATIMHNIQKLIDKPIIIQADASVEFSNAKSSIRKPKSSYRDNDDIDEDIRSEVDESINESIAD